MLCKIPSHLVHGLVLLLLVSLATVARAQPGSDPDLVFANGFESGTFLPWTPFPAPPPAPSCVRGEDVGGVREGDLGAAPGGFFEELTCVEIRNDQPFERRGELAWSSIPVPRSAELLTVDELVLIGPGERRLAAQFEVVARWGGTVDDATRPIRWLGVAVQPRVAAQSTAVYALRRYAGAPVAADPFAAGVTAVATAGGERRVVDTGAAVFTLDPSHPALFESIEIDGRRVYEHGAAAGPRLVVDPGDGPRTLTASVDPQGFELVENGPVKVVAMLRGHLADPAGSTLCAPYGVDPYERFGYTLVVTFTRASRDLGLEVYLRNECSDAFGGSWTDDAVRIEAFSWNFPFTALGEVSRWGAGTAVVQGAPGAAGSLTVEQRKGAGQPWRRRARLRDAATVRQSAETFERPLVALADADLVVAASLPWMRFREPQALAVTGRTVSLRFVSEPLVVGEAKGIWNVAKLVLTPRATLDAPLAEHLEALRSPLRAELERGLLVRSPRPHVNASRLYPSLGSDAPSAIKTAYLETIDALHRQTVEPGGQWDRAKTFGSQLWPDVQFDQWSVDVPSSPADNDGAMNYWNPSGAELLEYLRSGEPRWVWDFALPQSRLQLHSAYVNLGEHDHGNRNGAAATSGGSGEGHWHRSAFGSDDYSYNAGLHLAYVLRPSPAMRRRFAQAGRMIAGRYGETDEAAREQFVSEIDITRQVIQHFEMLANCAELVPGADGAACDARLREIVAELAHDNLRGGLMCQGDRPTPGRCDQPQQFMQNAMMYLFFHRYLLNWGDVEGRLERALTEGPARYARDGLPRRGDGSVDVGGEWASILECDLAGEAVTACRWVQNGDGNLLWANKPHTLALLLMAQELDGSLGLCQLARAALAEPQVTIGWDDHRDNEPGWWKGAAQMLQGMVFGVGIVDGCGAAP